MKNIFKLLFILLGCQAWAQDKFPVCTETYFSNKKVSTKQCMDSTRHFGKAFAYNEKGTIIGEWEISRMHMYSSVSFTFHANGAVHQAKYSSHPDGGIQWYKSITTYNDKGEKTGFTEDSHDQMEKILRPSREEILKEQEIKKQESIEKEQKTEKVQQDETEVAPVRKMSYLWIENTTKKKILITYYEKNTIKNEDTVWVNAAEKKKIILHIDQNEFKDPYLLYDFKLTNEKGKSKKYKILPEAKLDEKVHLLEEKNFYHLLKK